MKPDLAVRRHYVYYRVAEEALAEAAAAASALLALHGPFELLRRPGVHDGLVTLMEVYGADDATLAAALEAEARVTLAPWLVGERHVEAFDTVGQSALTIAW